MAMNKPSSPQEWHQWATSPSLSKIPAMASQITTGTSSVTRDVYVDVSHLQTAGVDFTYVYTDILALSPAPTVQLPLPALASITIFSRVITSEAPVNIHLTTASDDAAQVIIWATYVDQPITVSLGNGSPQALNLGVMSGNVGVSLTATKGTLAVEYYKSYFFQDIAPDGDLYKMLATQLRITSVLFWTQPMVAALLALHVVRTTVRAYGSSALLNIQASAILQQIRAADFAGPGTSYAPVLKLDFYRNSMVTILTAGAAFQAQYDRFTDNKATVDDQLKAWDSMLVQAQSTLAMQQQLALDAKSKWLSAQQILSTAQNDMKVHQWTLDVKASAFRAGIAIWQRQKTLDAVVNILQAIVTFALAIGAICIGDPAPAAAAPAEAAAAVESAAAAADAAAKVTGSIIDKKTLENIQKVVTGISTMVHSTIDNANAINSAAAGGSSALSPFPEEQGDGDLQALVGGAAWDKWILGVEAQMGYAVSEGIGGASGYLLELRNHAINGKLTTQASAQAVKAGQEYVHHQLALQLAQADMVRLHALRLSFKNEADQLDVARLHFYDRLDAMRTSTLIELRNIMWAFKFYTLTDSSLVLDPSKRMEEYQADLSQLVREVESYEEGTASDKSPIHFVRDIKDPCFDSIGLSVIAALQQQHSATFALVPRPSTGDKALPYPAGPFTDGSAFRVFGMRVVLQGLVPKPSALSQAGTAVVWITVGTSGIYNDIRRDNAVFGFTSLPQIRQFKYLVDAQGKAVNNGIEVDSIITMSQHMDPPPFTQWSITIDQPDLFDLTNLTGVQLEWQGVAYM
ncbi:uncharacterized protein SCHCODRAFT_02626537 [Schizophyllum commune H4-8]|uniref:uncharacterized protein n=1 Tax=Schizophyllum commune (strain H4-8 / FGSC 9210) TaxID=578458 RepID=UPI00216059E5|nr:uncharacterized protein SCHCODRAFT_02626537 [Schizophyllum commune H4-8]KAI5892587.1 hypothetical protein SCHCODRAFT_02626537 [Schizophyllum commune H4-8]